MEIKVFENIPQAARELREEVFIKEQKFPYDYDKIDEYAAHIIMFYGEKAIAVCRVFGSETPDVYILGRLAVKKDYRGHGHGKEIVRAASDYVLKCGGKKLILHSQLSAKAFYENVGFTSYGEIEDEAGSPHIWMEKKLDKK